MSCNIKKCHVISLQLHVALGLGVEHGDAHAIVPLTRCKYTLYIVYIVYMLQVTAIVYYKIAVTCTMYNCCALSLGNLGSETDGRCRNPNINTEII